MRGKFLGNGNIFMIEELGEIPKSAIDKARRSVDLWNEKYKDVERFGGLKMDNFGSNEDMDSDASAKKRDRMYLAERSAKVSAQGLVGAAIPQNQCPTSPCGEAQAPTLYETATWMGDHLKSEMMRAAREAEDIAVFADWLGYSSHNIPEAAKRVLARLIERSYRR